MKPPGHVPVLIGYGYFSDRQAARRARAGRALLSRLSLNTQVKAFVGEAWCEAMSEGEAEGWFNRSSERWFEFLPKLYERVQQKLQDGVLKALNGEEIDPGLLSFVPGRTGIMEKYREWEKNRDPMIFVKKSIFNGQNGKRIDPRVGAIIQTELAHYLHPNEIYPSQVLDAVNSEVRRKNIALGIAGDDLLPETSLSTIERRINELDQFEVLAARKGVAYAKNKLGAHVGGIKLHAPLLRVEMDEWEIDLIAILQGAGIDITHPSLRDLELGRYGVAKISEAVRPRSLLNFPQTLLSSCQAQAFRFRTLPTVGFMLLVAQCHLAQATCALLQHSEIAGAIFESSAKRGYQKLGDQSAGTAAKPRG
ncbi:hypothetical protein [Ruegeria sp. Ofav3-42]|uniref:hypothetical protein n=1 Tax=Ruegeria sp. Ofav3-42 TaxID=2917759 RepID=UPI001EF4FFF0|nr:hypothetical protein [Ruegeria sp. Ofav3-42]MCG7521929.1 hypothetical protein [Ruegeria sp. Ofav3-42]